MNQQTKKLREKAQKLVSKGKLDKAEVLYEEILQKENRDPDLWCELASLQIRSTKKGQASVSYYRAAEIYEKQGRAKHALAACKKAADLDVKHAAARHMLKKLKKNVSQNKAQKKRPQAWIERSEESQKGLYTNSPDITPLPKPAPGLMDWDQESSIPGKSEKYHDRDSQAWEDRSSIIVEMIPLPDPEENGEGSSK